MVRIKCVEWIFGIRFDVRCTIQLTLTVKQNFCTLRNFTIFFLYMTNKRFLVPSSHFYFQEKDKFQKKAPWWKFRFPCKCSQRKRWAHLNQNSVEFGPGFWKQRRMLFLFAVGSLGLGRWIEFRNISPAMVQRSETIKLHPGLRFKFWEALVRAVSVALSVLATM